MKEYIKFWQFSHYTYLASIIIACIGAFLKIASNPNLRPFKIYFILYSLNGLLFSTKYIISFKLRYEMVYDQFLFTCDLIFTIFEYFIFSNYIFNSTHSKSLNSKSLIDKIFLSSTLLIIIVSLFLSREITTDAMQYVFIVQAICLLIYCSAYYFDIFMSLNVKKLENEPSFYVVTGTTFFMICTIPVSFIMNYLWSIGQTIFYQAYSIIYIFYMILFLMIIKAFLCKPIKSPSF